MSADDFMQRPLAQKIIWAHSNLIEFWCFGKTHRPEEQAKRDHARATLDHLAKTCPVTYAAVMRRLNPR